MKQYLVFVLMMLILLGMKIVNRIMNPDFDIIDAMGDRYA